MKKLTYVFIILSLCLCAFMLSSCEKTYEIIYELDGGVNSAENPSEYQKGEIVKLNFPEKDGYMFAGWYTEPEHENLIMEINADTKDDITLYARWENVEDVLTLELDEKTLAYSVTDCSESARLVIIPEKYNGYPIAYIGDLAFEKCEQLEYVNIPETVSDIGIAAFSDCKALKEVNIPDKITKIRNYTFQNCDSLKEITLSKNIYRIGACAFADCDSLTKVNFFEETYIDFDVYAFSNCDSLKEMEFYKVSSFSLYIFAGCDSLEKLTVHNCNPSVYFQWGVFENCPALKELVLGDGVSITSFVYAPSSLEKITVSETNKYIKSIDGVVYSKDGKELLCYPKGKKGSEFTVPAGVTRINNKSFVESVYLESITIPDGVEYIGADAFSNCTNLKSVDISDSVKEIGARAFAYCSSLKIVKISNSIEKINASTFTNCTALESIIIPDGVSMIEKEAFNRCTSLKNVTLPDSVILISVRTFGYCESLESIIIPHSVEYITALAFESTPLVVYCEAENQPKDWKNGWDTGVKSVVWGYKEN